MFGIGRSFWAKAAALGMVVIAHVWPFAQVVVSALSPADVEVVRPEELYGLTQYVLAIFVAIVAPDLVGRDQRNRTLSLYFSRALRREDYALAKYAAFVTAMLTITLLPQVVMFVGNASAASDVPEYISDNWQDIPAIVGSALLLSCMVGGIGLAIGSQTPQRTYSTVAIVAVFVLGTGVAASFFEAAGASSGKYALLLSPLHIVDGFTYWFFGEAHTAQDNDQIAEAGIAGSVYALDAAIISIACVLFVIRRYKRIPA